ncbi:hypothetical protein, partial [Enterobacter cloacae]|uniref:hypothetical protein n=1 Tax=Enterobacter cloacae TaxID=550 RepID=UPI0019688AE6
MGQWRHRAYLSQADADLNKWLHKDTRCKRVMVSPESEFMQSISRIILAFYLACGPEEHSVNRSVSVVIGGIL